MMDALWLVSLHVVAAMTWIAGMVVLGIADLEGSDATCGGMGRRVVQRWNRFVTTPAMLLIPTS